MWHFFKIRMVLLLLFRAVMALRLWCFSRTGLQPYWPHSSCPSDSLVMVAGLCVPNLQKLRHGFRVRSAPPYAVLSYYSELRIGSF